jgi:hypothetical protein
MTERDLEVTRKFLTKAVPVLGQVRSVLALSPDHRQYQLLRETFPDAQIVSLTQEAYDIDDGPAPGGLYDVAFLGNVFMYCKKPTVWFRNLLESSRVLLVQDLIRAWRGGDMELGQDGDSLRFSFSSMGELARVPETFDVDDPKNGVKTIALSVYSEPTAHPPERSCMKFVALFERAQGDQDA